MQKFDNIIQEKLKELNELPQNLSFDGAKTWQQMEEKLQQKTSGKNVWWRMAAIFVLVVAGGIVFFLSNETSDVQPRTATYTPGVSEEKKPGLTVSNEEKILVPQKITTAEKKPGTSSAKYLIVEKDNIIQEDPIVSNIPSTTVVNVIAPNNPTAEINITAPPAVIATIAVKKPKLHVVHLNDIYKPEPAEIAKAETKKQQAEEMQETEAAPTPPSKPFWRSKAPTRITISLTDNQ